MHALLAKITLVFLILSSQTKAMGTLPLDKETDSFIKIVNLLILNGYITIENALTLESVNKVIVNVLMTETNWEEILHHYFGHKIYKAELSYKQQCKMALGKVKTERKDLDIAVMISEDLKPMAEIQKGP